MTTVFLFVLSFTMMSGRATSLFRPLLIGGGLVAFLALLVGLFTNNFTEPLEVEKQDFDTFVFWNVAKSGEQITLHKDKDWCLRIDNKQAQSLTYTTSVAQLLKRNGGKAPKQLNLSGAFNTPDKGKVRLMVQVIRKRTEIIRNDDEDVSELIGNIPNKWTESQRPLVIYWEPTNDREKIIEPTDEVQFFLKWTGGSAPAEAFADDLKLTAE